MNKKFPIFRYLVLVVLVVAAVAYYLFLPKESVFSDGVLGQFAHAKSGGLIPMRPLSTYEIFKSMTNQFERAGLETGFLIDANDPRLDSDLGVFAAYSAQIIGQVARVACESNDFPNNAILSQLNAEIVTMQQKALRWDGKLKVPTGRAAPRIPSGEAATALNIFRWSEILDDSILATWKTVRAFEQGDKPYSDDNLVQFRDSLENVIADVQDGQGVNLIFRPEMEPGMKILAIKWRDTCDTNIEPASSESELWALTSVNNDTNYPLIIRQYAASQFVKNLPMPASTADLQPEIERLLTAKEDPTYADFKVFLDRRLSLVKITAAMSDKFIKTGEIEEDLLGGLEAAANTGFVVESNFVDNFRQLEISLKDAKTTEANLLRFNYDDLQICLDKWGQVVTKGSFLGGLADFPSKHREPFEKLADLVGPTASEPESNAERWQELAQCRTNYSQSVSLNWKRILFRCGHPYFPIHGDRTELVSRAAELSDTEETKWVANLLAFLADRDRLQAAITNFEQFSAMPIAGADGTCNTNLLECREAVQYLAMAGKVRDLAAQIMTSEDALSEAVLVDSDYKPYEEATRKLDAECDSLKELLQSQLAEDWSEAAESHFAKWQTTRKIFTDAGTGPNPLAAQMQSLNEQFADALGGSDARLPAFIAAVRFQKTDFSWSPEIGNFIKEQKKIATQLSTASLTLNQNELAVIAVNHGQIAAAATAYNNFCTESDFLTQDINNLPDEPVASPTWLENRTNSDLVWWQNRRPESEPAHFEKDIAALWKLKFTWPSWKDEYPNMETWVNKALSGEDYASLCDEATVFSGTVLTEKGKQLGLALTSELALFQAAQIAEGTGDWANAIGKYVAIDTKNVRSALFKQARMKRLTMLTENHVYNIPKGFQFDLKSSIFRDYEGNYWGAVERKFRRAKPNYGFCIINGAQTNWIGISGPLKHVYDQDPSFNVGITISENFQFSWDGNTPLNLAFYYTPFSHDTVGIRLFRPKLVYTLQNSSARGLFEFARQIGITPSELGFPYLEPSVEIQGRIPPPFQLNRNNIETNATTAQDILKKATDFSP